MDHRIRIPVRNRGVVDLTVVIEPWASEICLTPGEDGEVVLVGNGKMPEHSVEICSYGLIFWAENTHDLFELYTGGVRWG